MRLLFARIGTPYCHICGKKIERQTIEEIASQVLRDHDEKTIMLLAPFIRGKKGEYRHIQNQISKAGFARMRIDGQIFDVQHEIKLDKYKIHHIDIVVDRLTIKPTIKKRLTDSLEIALKIGHGLVIVTDEKTKDQLFRTLRLR
jgi:excinuclease ABC subunit A